MRLRPYLTLLRPPNLFTAAGDVIAGYLVVTGGLSIGGFTLAALVVASVSLYAGGVVLNDYFDRDVDRLERPERPIPSGGVRPSHALALGLSLLAAGSLLAGTSGPASAMTALLLAAAILLYDGHLKRVEYVGSLSMGLCRFLNVLLGASGAASDAQWWATAFPSAALVMAYIASVTILSTGEVWGGNRAVASAVLAAIATVAFGVVWLRITGALPLADLFPFVLVFAFATLRAVGRVVAEPSAANIRVAIKTCVLSLLLLDAAIAAGAAGWQWGVAVAALVVPSIAVSRVFAVT